MSSAPASIVSTPTPTSEASQARPLFFSIADRPAYAVYHPPHGGRHRSAVVVHCHTLGVEQLTSYRVEVLGARAAAAAGYPVFRYHARGHGDSAGNLAEVTFESLVEDARAAAEHAKQLSGASRVVWLGVRFGALVAAEAARGSDDVAALALWEPVHDPQEYFRGMLRNLLFSFVVKGERPSVSVDDLLHTIDREGLVAVHGYYLHRALVASSRALSLERSLAAWAGPTFLAQVQRRGTLAPAHAALGTALAKRGATVATVQINDEPGWHFLSNPAWEGAGLVERYAEWIDALA